MKKYILTFLITLCSIHSLFAWSTGRTIEEIVYENGNRFYIIINETPNNKLVYCSDKLSLKFDLNTPSGRNAEKIATMAFTMNKKIMFSVDGCLKTIYPHFNPTVNSNIQISTD